VRTIFFALVLANAALAAYLYWLHTEQRTPPPIVNQQIAPERMRLISPQEAERLAAARTTAAGAGCVEWGAFAPGEAARAAEALEGLGVKTRERRQEDAARWWVVMAPLPTRAAANARVAELRKQGVDDVTVIDEDAGGQRNGISLGLYSSEDGARRRADALAKRGVNGTRIVPRDAVVRVFLQVREAPEGFRGRAAELKGAWPAAELRDCPPEGKS
jgi:hypothetical protein